MSKPQLTDRQKDVYELIRSLIQDRGYGPTVREIGENFGIKSPNGVMCHLRALEKKGLIIRKANKSRAIELTGDHARSKTGLTLMGVVSDLPTEIPKNPTEAIDLGASLATGDRFVVQYSGDALSTRGVLDGDYLILEVNEQIDDGQLVGQLILTKFGDGRVALQVWSSQSGDVEVLGRVVSLVREDLRID